MLGRTYCLYGGNFDFTLYPDNLGYSGCESINENDNCMM